MKNTEKTTEKRKSSLSYDTEQYTKVVARLISEKYVSFEEATILNDIGTKLVKRLMKEKFNIE